MTSSFVGSNQGAPRGAMPKVENKTFSKKLTQKSAPTNAAQYMNGLDGASHGGKVAVAPRMGAMGRHGKTESENEE